MSSTKQIQYFGVSVKGPRHLKLGSPNQDHWLGRQNRSGTLITVCDGLGSRSNSELGSQIGCQAAWDAFQLWEKARNTNQKDFLRLVKILWDIRVLAEKNNFATTCLFAAFTPENRLLLAGLGDGLAVIKFPDNRLEKVVWRNAGFGNETLALGTDHSLADWVCYSIDQVESGTIVLLASDGIADDLIEEKIPEFIEWLVETFGPLPARERYFKLAKTLKDWPTPRHQDDKTLAIMIVR